MGTEDHTPPSLSSPLIQASEEDDAVKEIEKDEGNHGRGFKRKEIVEEVKKQLWLAGPLVCVSLLQYSVQIIAVMFVGHLGELSLSGASMALSFSSVTGFSLLMGMSSALDTLSGQCYALGQDAAIAAQAGQFARFLIPSLFAYGLLQCLVRFLQTQNIVFPMMLSSAITALLHIPLCWILVFTSGLGSRGAALAVSISFWINVLFLALYVRFSSLCSKTWTGFSKEAFHNIIPFVRLAIPSAVMVCLEMWSFELIVLLSGLLPNPKLETSVLSISLNTAAMVWMIPFGLSSAVSTRVSNELGAGRPETARLAVCVVLVMAITVGLLVGSVLILIRNFWGYAYSNETQVVKYLATMMPILATSNFLDGLQCVLSGTARGCGWQKIGAYINLGSYYLVGIPLAIVFSFVIHIGGKGLWLGIICALIVQVFSLLTVTVRTNWEKEAKKATERVYDTTVPVDIES
ncbi:protein DETOXIFICATION 16-like [Prunus yedoensis var. nudiflora]|uniref:Protein DETOXIFICATION n=1 Tax=Prunus yedoensis var. nudiflora TaxID=2094558 RepID=A0A314ZE77_PRUYE|nr:protein DETOXIFICATION 16-like [Prunus yedoensis var. nudiflora]